MKRKPVSRIMLILIIASTLCMTSNVAPVLTEETTEDYPLLGFVDAVGTYFKISDSTYLNITLTSSETIHVILESVPRMVSFSIESNSSASSTLLSFSGFESNAIYYRYQDGYLVEDFTTDSSGGYAYTQDISQGHHVCIQEETSTLHIWSDYTFTGDVYETIVVEADDIVIDGNGYTLQGPGHGYGFWLPGRNGVTIKNVTIKDWSAGIFLSPWAPPSSGNTFSGNTIANILNYGIYLYKSSDNIVSGNTVAIDGMYGVLLYYSSHNAISGNIVTNTGETGIFLGGDSRGNTISGNTITGGPLQPHGNTGIKIQYSGGNTVSGNTITNHNRHGIQLYGPGDHIVSDNRITDNEIGIEVKHSDGNPSISGNTIANNGLGISLFYSSSIAIYHNNIIDNAVQADDTSPATNYWHNPDLSEGNYWSDYSGVDDGSGTGKHAIAGDRIGDTDIPWPGPDYDYYPFTRESGWLFITATVDIDPDTLNLKSNGEFVTAYIELPEGYNVADIVLETVYLDGIQAIADPAYGFVTDPDSYLMDHDGDGILERMVKFDRATVRDTLTDVIDYTEGTKFYDLTLTVTGQLTDGTPFEGTDTIVVIKK